MVEIWVAVITAIIAPVVLFVLQQLRERKDGYKQTLKELRLVTLRLEILFNISHNAHDHETILRLYDKYHKLGGNSYISKLIQDKMKEWDKETKRRKK